VVVLVGLRITLSDWESGEIEEDGADVGAEKKTI